MKDKTLLFPIPVFFILMLFALSFPAFAENAGEEVPIEVHTFHTHLKENVPDSGDETSDEAPAATPNTSLQGFSTV